MCVIDGPLAHPLQPPSWSGVWPVIEENNTLTYYK